MLHSSILGLQSNETPHTQGGSNGHMHGPIFLMASLENKMTHIPKYPSKGEVYTSRKTPVRPAWLLYNRFPVGLKRAIKAEMIETTVHILSMFNFFHYGNKSGQKFCPDAWTQLTAVNIKYVRF